MNLARTILTQWTFQFTGTFSVSWCYLNACALVSECNFKLLVPGLTMDLIFSLLLYQLVSSNTYFMLYLEIVEVCQVMPEDNGVNKTWLVIK